MKFRFTGHEPSDLYGFKWFPGTVHEVEDAHAVKKLSNHPMFEVADGAKETAQRFAPKPGGLEDFYEQRASERAAAANVTPIKKPRAKKAAG